jgi:hypothetical protein
LERVAQRWKLSNYELHRAVWIVSHQTALDNAACRPWSQMQRLLIAEHVVGLVALYEAKAKAAGSISVDAHWCRQQLALPAEQLDPPPLIDGHDLLRHGVPQGKLYSVLLERLRDAQLDGLIAGKSQALELVDRWLSEGKMELL